MLAVVVFDHCKHVRIEGVTIQNSPSWQVVPYYTDNTVIRNVRILAPEHSPNTDAIDPFSSSNMVIDHVYADVGDDNIAIKSGIINSPGPDSPSTNITITDCEFMHGHGLSIGSEIAGGANNIHAERIHFKGTDQGIRIKANRDRGNQVYNISFKDITIENVNSTKSGIAGVIVGLPESPVKNVILKNVNIAAEKGMTIAYADVSGSDVHLVIAKGQAMTKAAKAKVDIK